MSGEIDGDEFEGETRFDRLFAGITVECPRNLDIADRSGIEDIIERGDARYNDLLVQAHEKNVSGLASPTGFEPVS